MAFLVQQNTTSQKRTIFVQNSSSTVGAGLTGLTYTTGGLTAYYIKDGDSSTTVISLITATLGTWTSGGFIVVDGTNMPGMYEIGIPNAALTALGSVKIYLQGATNMAPCVLEIQVVAFNPNDAVHLGLSALPNTACTTNGSLITSGTGTAQLSVSSGVASANATQINGVSTSSVTTINANLGQTQPVNFTGTGTSAYIKADLETILTVAVSTTTAQLGVNVVKYNNITQSTDANGYPKVDVVDWLGAAVTSAVSGLPDVNVKNINAIATTSVTTVSAIQGTTVALTFDGNNAVKADVVDWLGTAVTAATAGIPDVNAKNINNVATTSVTAIGAYIGNATHAIAVDSSGYVTYNNTAPPTTAQIWNYAGLNTTTVGTPGYILYAQLGQMFISSTSYIIDANTMPFIAPSTSWLQSVGTTTPPTADVYQINGFQTNNPYYQTITLGVVSGTQMFLWYNGSGWTISEAVGTNGTYYWTSTTLTGTYTAQGSASGNAVVTQYGTAANQATIISDIVALGSPMQASSYVAPNNTDIVATYNIVNSGTYGNSALLTAIDAIPTNPYTGTPPTVAQIATAVWTDTTSGDFSTGGSPGKILVSQLGGTFTTSSSSIFSVSSLANAPSGGGGGPTAAQIATAVWQDTTASDFSTPNSVGLGLFTGIAPGAANGLSLVGSAMTLTSAERTATARANYAFDLSTVSGEAVYSPINALRKLRNWSISETTLTVYKEDGVTPAYTQELAGTPAASGSLIISASND